MIKEKRKNKVEPYGKKEKFKIRIKLPKFWWLIAMWLIFVLFGNIFTVTDKDIPDYMTTIEKGDSGQDPSLYQDPDDEDNVRIYNNSFDGYKYPEQQTDDSMVALLKILFNFPFIFFVMILTIPVIFTVIKEMRRW